MEGNLTVRRSKTTAGERVIPLNADAWAAILELWERAKTYGGTEPEHYVFPTCEGYTQTTTQKSPLRLCCFRKSLIRLAGPTRLETGSLRDTILLARLALFCVM
jgi:integrase